MRVGKAFEDRFYKFLTKRGCYWYSFYDYPGKVEGDGYRFMPKHPYDVYFMFKGSLYCFELKSTNSGRFSIGRKGMIKPHQVSGLYKASKFDGVYAGFLFEDREFSNVWFVGISDFVMFTEGSGKSSLNFDDIKSIGLRVAGARFKQGALEDIRSYLS